MDFQAVGLSKALLAHLTLVDLLWRGGGFSSAEAAGLMRPLFMCGLVDLQPDILRETLATLWALVRLFS